MNTMAGAIGSSVGSYIHEKKNNVVIAITAISGSKSLRNVSFWSKQCGVSVRASSKSRTPKGLDMINGKKVNGIYIGDSPLMNNNIDEETPLHACLRGKFVEDRFVYRQNFFIRSYEIGPDKTATMETLMNLLQVSF